MTAVERSRNLRVARMDPILQFMAGPLLRYDTVDADGVWHGAALIVSELQSDLSFVGTTDGMYSVGRRIRIRALSYLDLLLGPRSSRST